MIVIWPWLLLSLLIVPILIGLYVWMLRRRQKFVVSYSSLSLIREALPPQSKWRRHVPFGLFALGTTFLLLALARPAAEVEIPLSQSTIVLAIDVSRSMCAIDVRPNRLTVAQEAALGFIDEQPRGTKIGIVAFADFAEIIVPPTDDKERLVEAINGFSTTLGTAIGSATLKGIDAIAEINPNVQPSGVNLRAGLENPEDFVLPEDEYQPEIIVVLTDGANSNGPLPLAAAQQAQDRQIRVYTIGFGTDDPQDIVCTAAQAGSLREFGGGGGFGGGGFGGGFGGGGLRRFLVIDEPTLQAMADMTGGEYFKAENANQLIRIFQDLPSRIVLQTEARELSAIFVALGGLFVAIGVILSLLRNRFP